MGRPTGFLEIERRDRPYEKPEIRGRTWKEFVKPLPDAENRKQAARCMDCGIPFCHEGCPVNNLIPDWNNLVYRDHWRTALTTLHSTNNFPEFTGRVCPAPCEAACTLNIDDNPVTIKTIEPPPTPASAPPPGARPVILNLQGQSALWMPFPSRLQSWCSRPQTRPTAFHPRPPCTPSGAFTSMLSLQLTS
jgi:hypothetical protein